MFNLPPSTQTSTYLKGLPTPLLFAYEPWCTYLRIKRVTVQVPWLKYVTKP
ncbi:hypothetical protein BN8_01794 [Fibrisoma limi BUZ 3]|uniref:Uncharacterized protein n=1 Tax=Fibrisoma limi BUZ 3 TaxID=1185876 RepID=I2GFU3_9BACT|nr:hypothetical protein BN8_01794 [Fibrisoma limi BUZ 3]